MKEYKVGDKVLFHVDVIHVNPVEGEIVEIGGNGTYIIQHKGLKCGVQEKFIVSKVLSDKEIIHDLEVRILDDDKKLQIFNKRLAETNSELLKAKQTISELKERIRELERTPFSGYNYKKRRERRDPILPFEIPPMVPRWSDLDHEQYRKKYACGFLEY